MKMFIILCTVINIPADNVDTSVVMKQGTSNELFIGNDKDTRVEMGRCLDCDIDSMDFVDGNYHMDDEDEIVFAWSDGMISYKRVEVNIPGLKI